MKIETGRRYRVINSQAGHNGMVVTVTGYAGPDGFEGYDIPRNSGGRYYIDKYLKATDGIYINHIGRKQLELINDDDSRDVITWESMSDIWVPAGVEA